MTTTSSWPEPLLLPGQAAAPEGPCDLTGMYVMHHCFRRDLARFAAAARTTEIGDRARWQAQLTWWDRFGAFLHEHHLKEDEALWPFLLERVDGAGDAEARSTLEAMEVEHHAIDPALAAVTVALTDLAHPGEGARDRAALVAAVAEAQQILDNHLAHEERDAIEILQRYVDGPAWAHLEATRLAQKPGPKDLLFFLPWVADELPAETFAKLLGSGPAPVRLLLGVFVRWGRKGYQRARLTAFGS